MRKMLLLAATGIGLALGRAGAEVIPLGDEALSPFSTYNEQLVTANSVAPAIDGRPALPVDDGRGAAAVERVSVDRAFRIDRETGVQALVWLAIAAIVAAFGGGGGIAVRILDEGEFPSGGVAGQSPSGLLRANLASLDGLVVDHSAGGT
jgi:hypothetical protein